MILRERSSTAMAREIAEIPAACARALSERSDVSHIADRIRNFAPRFVVICGRGSSGHAGIFLRYLFEVRVGLLVSASAPSVVTAYRKTHDMSHILFVVISQSGRSPDLVAATEQARKSGALTVALLNDPTSPVAREAELVLPMEAGAEHAVAATKTVALSMMRGAQLIADMTSDRILLERLQRLPERLDRALGCDWSSWGNSLKAARAAFVTARGYGLGTAKEIALKLTETMRLPALGYSAAELRHGPFAAVTAATPVLALRSDAATSSLVDQLIADLKRQDQMVFSAGGPDSTLEWIGDDHPVCDPIALLLPAYVAIEAAARQQGFDPDRPLHLSKVTETL
jgi:glucosamine--fructose-6-phosphate aminotransferase (isomerizing)